MISPPSGYDQVIDIKTDNIYLTIKRRKQPPIVSEELLFQESKLEAWGTNLFLQVKEKQQELLPDAEYVRIKVPPLFFEQTDYVVNAKTMDGSPLFFQHANDSIRESLSMSFNDPGMLSGTINFGSEVGYSVFHFSDDKGNHLLVEIEVFPAKLTYKEDYEAIRNEINEMAEAAAIDFLRSTFSLGSTSISRNNIPAIFFTLISQLFDKYYKATNVIMRKPTHRLLSEHNVLPLHKVKRTDSKSLNWLGRHTEFVRRESVGYLAEKALSITKRITYDTIENQIVKFMLRSTVKRLQDFRRKFILGYCSPEKTCNSVLSKADEMITKIKVLLDGPVLRDVSCVKTINTMSLVFQMAPGYKELLRYYLAIQRGISFNGEVFNLSLKDTATLYEYWCFIKLVSIMKKNYTLLENGEEIIRTDKKGITVALAKGKKSEVRFIDTKTGDKFKLIYNPNDYRSDTIKQIPDNVLCLEKNTGMGSLVENYQYVFDAKYKVEMNPDEHYPDCSPGPKITDINTMHRYRDAIVYRNGEVNEKIIFGAYVLFPYPGSEEEYKSHHFYNSISTVNIGGLPFLPQKTKMVEEMLFRLVSESNVSAFERSILPKGIESRLARVDWSKQDVLVGSLSSADQFNTVLRDNYYYVPVRSMPQERIQVSYIAIYQSQRIFGRDAGIRYYGEVVYSDIRKRKAINNLPGRTSPEDYCYFYVISEWKKLDRRIDFEEEWVYKPRYTSLFLLKHCIKTFELFNIRSEEAYRLVYELRRVQKNIRVKDHPKDLFVKFNENISIYNDDRSIYVFFNGKTIIKRSTEVFAKHAGSVFLEMSKMIEKKETSANL